MLNLPTYQQLIRAVEAALDTVAEANSVAISSTDWTPSIMRQLNTHVIGLADRENILMGQHGQYLPSGRLCGGEWLRFDYCALVYDPKICRSDQFMAQAALVGELEQLWRGDNIEKDFEKLLIVDSIVCFFVFRPPKAQAEKITNKLMDAGSRRRRYSIERGNSQPPVFLFSYYCDESKKFTHRVCD